MHWILETVCFMCSIQHWAVWYLVIVHVWYGPRVWPVHHQKKKIVKKQIFHTGLLHTLVKIHHWHCCWVLRGQVTMWLVNKVCITYFSNFAEMQTEVEPFSCTGLNWGASVKNICVTQKTFQQIEFAVFFEKGTRKHIIGSCTYLEDLCQNAWDTNTRIPCKLWETTDELGKTVQFINAGHEI